MSPLSWLFAATFLDLVQGVQDYDGLRVISALGEVSSQAVNHGKACWAQCRSLGSCPGFCGHAGACCRMGIGKEAECSAGGIGCTKKACCVKSATVSLDNAGAVGSMMLENKDPDQIKQEDNRVIAAATKLEEIELQKLQEVSTSAANAAKQAALDAGMTSDKASAAAVKAALQAAADAEKKEIKSAEHDAQAAVIEQKAADTLASTSKVEATATLSLKKDTANVAVVKQVPFTNVTVTEAPSAAHKTNEAEKVTQRTLPQIKPSKHTTPAPISESAAPGAKATLELPKGLKNPTLEHAKGLKNATPEPAKGLDNPRLELAKGTPNTPKTNLTLQVPMPGTNKKVALNLTVSLKSNKTGSDVKLTDSKTTAAPEEAVTGTTSLPQAEDPTTTEDQDLPFDDGDGDMPVLPPATDDDMPDVPATISSTDEPVETLGLDDVQNYVQNEEQNEVPLEKRLATLDEVSSQDSARLAYFNAFRSVQEKLIYLHNAFRCLHASPSLVWDANLESDMKSAISSMSWTMELGISALPNKTGVVAVNIFWNAGEESPRPEESVSAWYEQCDNCTGGCSGFADGCPSSPSTPTTQFRNVVRSDVAKVACVNSADSKTLVCFYSTGDSARVSDVGPRVKLAKPCHAAVALSFTKKLLCVTSSTTDQAQKAVTLEMLKCTKQNSQSLIARRGSLEFKDPGGTCVTVGQEVGPDGCHMVTLETCNDESKYQQFRAWKVDAYGDNEQELWKNPATNTTLGIKKRKIWSCTEASKIPFLRLHR